MIRKRVTANAAANVFAQVVNTLIQLGTVPLFLLFWSKERYGEWLIIYSIPGYMALADVGIPTVAANEASIQMAAGQVAAARRSIHTACGLLTFVAVALTALSAVLAFTLPWASWLRLTTLDAGETSLTLFLLGAYTTLGLFCALAGAIYRAAQRAPRGVYASSLSRLSELASMVGVLVSGGSIMELAAALFAVRVVTTVAMHVDTAKVAPELRLGVADFSWVELRRTLHPALLYMAFPIGNAFYFQGLTLLAGHLLGSGAVVMLNTCRALTRAIVQLVTIIKYAIMPEFSYLFGQQDLARARSLNALAFEVSVLSSGVLAVVLLALGPAIMEMWTHGVVMPDRALLALFLAGAVLNSIWNVSSVLLIGTNRHGPIAIWYLAVTLAALLLAIPLARSLGLEGLAWTMLTCEALLVPYTIVRTSAVLQIPAGRFLADALLMRETFALLRTQRQAQSAK